MKNTSFFIRHFIALGFVICIFACDKNDNNSTPTHTYTITGDATAAHEVPTNTSTGTGTLTGTYDANTNTLQYNVAYSGLTGAATGAHIHGPADTAHNASVLIPFTVTPSPIIGTAVLADSVETFLLNGQLYFNIHTAAHAGGEVRGQVKATPN